MSANRKSRRQQKKQARPATRQHGVVSKFPEVVRSLDLIQQLRGNGRSDEAAGLAQQLVNIEPGNPNVLLALAGSLQDGRRFDEAVAAYQRCIKAAPTDAAAPAQMAVCLMELGDLPGVIQSCLNALRLAPGALGLHQLAGKAYERMAQFREAAGHYETIAGKTGYHADYEQLGHIRFLANDIEGARAAFLAAIEAGAPPATMMVMLGRLETSRGHLEDGYKQLQSALETDPMDGYAHLQLADDFGSRIDVDRHIKLAEKALNSGQLPADQHRAYIPLQFALAQLHERNSNYDQAFAHFKQANDAIIEEQPDDHLNVAAQIREIQQVFKSDFVAEQSLTGNSSEQPVFVFGLPRSGTTLVEQILSSHSQAAGMGEMEALSWMGPYLGEAGLREAGMREAGSERAAIAAKSYLNCYLPDARLAQRVIDKSISTYLHAGRALSLFPNARFINCRRHPLDIAHSLYRMYFGPTNVPFANSFGRIAARFRLYEEMMAHWHEAFPGRFLDVHYEDLVRDPEKSAKSMISHTGLDWEDGCLAFHENKSIVQTASLTQVRQPIYTSSLQKWRRYEVQFADLAEDIADLVDKYETESA